MPKNIVICCDGTANQFGPDNTNVVRLYSVIERNPEVQATFYDPGVGTFTLRPVITRAGEAVHKALGLAFGVGLSRNVLDAYTFLMQSWEPDDRVFLFGFSRGAYTVRVLAGFIHKVGLLHADNTHLAPYALRMFEAAPQPVAGTSGRFVHEAFRDTFAREARVHFLGLWDTVSSYGWVWDPQSRPYTTRNESVDIVRHAIAIDERRAFFRQNLWSAPLAHQDVKQVWFAGCHSDVGGAFALARLPLEWMLVEARRAGLVVNAERALAEIGDPDPVAPMNESLRGAWKLAEYFPKLAWDARQGRRVPRLNRGARRRIPADAVVHESVNIRRERDTAYRPPNLPANAATEAWRRFEAEQAPQHGAAGSVGSPDGQ